MRRVSAESIGVMSLPVRGFAVAIPKPSVELEGLLDASITNS
jgi:hypothetical protein